MTSSREHVRTEPCPSPLQLHLGTPKGAAGNHTPPSQRAWAPSTPPAGTGDKGPVEDEKSGRAAFAGHTCGRTAQEVVALALRGWETKHSPERDRGRAASAAGRAPVLGSRSLTRDFLQHPER